MKPDPRRVTFARVFVTVAAVGAGGFIAMFELSEHARAPADFQAAFIIAAVWSVLLAARVARRAVIEAKGGAPLHVLHIASTAVAAAGVPLVCRGILQTEAEITVGIVAAVMVALAGILFRLGNAAQSPLSKPRA